MLSISMLKYLVLAIGFSKSRSANTTDDPINTASYRWDYGDKEGWADLFPLCGGQRQSPINLNLATAEQADYSMFFFNKYNQISNKTVRNTGRTLVMSLNNSGTNVPYITGGGLTGRFNFVQLHFHWGEDSKSGSEHHINSRPYPAEMHMVHYNTKYPSFNDAKQHQDGLAVLGIMIKVSRRDNVAFRHLEQIRNIIDPTNKSDYLTTAVPLSKLLPVNTLSFFRYNGSLTTPDCNENVIWTVFDKPIGISERQLNQFRQLKDEHGKPLRNNYRPLQKLRKRKVYYRHC